VDHDIYVMQVVSDGPEGFPRDEIVDVGICGIDLERMEVDSIYSMFVSYDDTVLTDDKKKYLADNGISADDVRKGASVASVCADVKRLLRGRTVASFDVRNVFYRYMVNEPWDLTKEVSVMPSVGSRLPRPANPGPSDENLSIRNAYRRIFGDEHADLNNGKRALDHALMSSDILIELRKRELY
jgi:hypothetical protein